MVCVIKFLKFLQNSCEKELLWKLLWDDVINNKKKQREHISKILYVLDSYTQRLNFFM